MDRPVCAREVTVNLKNGLHMNPSLMIAQLAQTFGCDVRIRKADREVDAKSMIELLTLVAEYGTPLTLKAEGDGASDAIEALARLFEANFAIEEPHQT